MNPEFVKTTLRYVVAISASAIAGWIARGGYVTTEQVSTVLNSEAFIALMTALAMGAWGIVSRTTVKMIAATARLPEVAAVHVRNGTADAAKEEVKGEADVKIVKSGA